MNWIKATKEEWDTYYKVRRERTMWDIASYLNWNISELDNNPYVHDGYNAGIAELDDGYNAGIAELDDEDSGIHHLNKCELLFMCEYVEEYFNIDSTISELIDDAYNIVLYVRNNDFGAQEVKSAFKIVERTIFLERYRV